MSERLLRSIRPGYPHPVYSELENSGIRVAVGDCSVTERRRWRPPYQTAKLYICTQTHHKHDEDGHGPLGERRYENWITHISQLSDNSLPPFISGKKAIGRTSIKWIVRTLYKTRLCKTRIVDFHWGKLAISEILLSYFQGVGDSIVFR